ncbi:hydrolase [Penicillium atrosanguineum]|uniref:hydrolase n=1 Tax=Penicillium atrosanguineum TaxID=1132637 RepID=UPI00239159AD|nr:hydrolase [Penicillium atrosanguineum]KAJ5289805.1 hydrolase [Penicillium atrosanguineum]
MGGYKPPMVPKRPLKKSPKKTPPKSPKMTFQWDDHRREVLCCLCRFFELARHDFQRIFSDIFRDHLLERGFPGNQMPYTRLYAQWTWMKRIDHPLWLFVHKETNFIENQEWKDILRQIRDSARRLRISLTEKENDATDEHKSESKISEDLLPIEQAVEIILQSVLSHSSSSDDVDNDRGTDTRVMPHPDTPSSFVRAQILSDFDDATTNERLLWGERCYWCEKDGPPPPVEGNQHINSDVQTDTSELMGLQGNPLSEEVAINMTTHVNLHGHCPPKDLPAVLYRWSNFNSQGINCRGIIRAGLFTTSGSVTFQPEDVSEEEFLEYFKLHVSKVLKPTPFISFFKKPLAPIHRGLQNGDGAAVFIIDTAKLSNKAFKAAPLVKLTDTARKKYKGYGEYLIWNEVPTDAIACTFTMTKLEKIAREHPDIAAFLQLPRIHARPNCTKFLYNDLAMNRPKSIDGYVALLEKFTALLGVPGTLRKTVAAGFKEAWFDNFRGFEYQAPDISDLPGRISEVGEIESHEPDDYYMSILPRIRSASYAPPADSDNDDSHSSSSNESRESEEAEAEAEAPCPRWDTPEAPFSTHDYSSDDDLKMPAIEPPRRRNGLSETETYEAWPNEEDYMRTSIRWPARMFAKGRPEMWSAYGM